STRTRREDIKTLAFQVGTQKVSDLDLVLNHQHCRDHQMLRPPFSRRSGEPAVVATFDAPRKTRPPTAVTPSGCPLPMNLATSATATIGTLLEPLDAGHV